MDWKQLIASIIGDLAWPIVALVIAFSLRHHIAGLLPNLKWLKYKDFEAAFGEQLAEAEKEVPKHERLTLVGADDEAHRYHRLAEMSPNAAVMEAWLPVESALRDVARHHGYEVTRGRSALNFIKNLGSKKILSPRLVSLLRDLRGLRNAAAHAVDEREISTDQALRFKELADYVRKELEKITGAAHG